MILYQILNTETGKKLVNTTYYNEGGKWDGSGAFWKKPDTIKNHLEHILYEWKPIRRYFPQQDYIDYEGKPVKAFSSYYDRWEKTDNYNAELAKRIQVIATEMQTIGAAKSYSVDHFMDSTRVAQPVGE